MRFNIDQIILNLNKRSYKYIGSGSGRKVFDLGNGYVVKVAKNSKGVAQNKAEFEIASGCRSRLFAKIPIASRDFSLLIMEKADRIRHMSKVWSYYNVSSNKELFQLKELMDIPTYGLLLPDLRKSASWGIIKNRPVIIDYGFTWYVKNKYY